LDCFESGKKQADQDSDDADDNEEFNEGERAVTLCHSGVHRAGTMMC
jgi:hypothetical protein